MFTIRDKGARLCDGLTRTANRRQLLLVLEREVGRAGRHGRPLSLLSFAVIRLAAINESHGFLTGDHVVREVARRAGAKLRPDDLLAHFGEGHFAAVLPETEKEGAQKLASAISESVTQPPIAIGEEQLQLSLAIGVATRVAESDAAALLRSAEEQLPPAIVRRS